MQKIHWSRQLDCKRNRAYVNVSMRREWHAIIKRWSASNTVTISEMVEIMARAYADSIGEELDESTFDVTSEHRYSDHRHSFTEAQI